MRDVMHPPEEVVGIAREWLATRGLSTTNETSLSLARLLYLQRKDVFEACQQAVDAWYTPKGRELAPSIVIERDEAVCALLGKEPND